MNKLFLEIFKNAQNWKGSLCPSLLQAQWLCHPRGLVVPVEVRLTLSLSTEVAGRFLVSDASTHLLVFGMEQRLPPNSELVQAVLRLFQEPVPRTALRRYERLSPHSARARVTIEWLRVREDGSNRTALIDSR